MNKQFEEPEEIDSNIENAEIIDDFNPLGEPVLEKQYTKHNVKVDPKDFQNDIPEPTFTPPPMSGGLKEDEKVKKPTPQEPINKEFNQMSNKDKNDAAGKFAEMCMTGYKALNSWVDSRLLFDGRKINKMAKEGQIDLSIQVPLAPNQTLSVAQFIEEYNDQTKGTIYVSKEFEAEVMPVLTRVLAKRGVGFSDEQYLGYLLIKDGLTKGFLMQQSLSVKKEFLQMFKEATETMRGGQATPPPPPPQQQYQPQPEPQPTPPPTFTQPQRNPDLNVNDFVNQMTGSYQEEPMPQPSQPQNDFIYEEPTIVEEIKEPEVVKAEIILDKVAKKKVGRPKRGK
jgi:hypothetical protein